MSTAVKYFDIDSTYRNRNNYPNPFDFVVPYSFPNKGTTTLSYIDPVLESAPFTGAELKQPGQLFTQTSPDSSNIKLDNDDISIDNFYININLQIGVEFRKIVYYDGSTRIATVDSPFSITPPSGTIYYTRRLSNYFNSNVAIVDYNQSTNTLTKLNLLTAAPSPVKNFYKGSYIRYTNGPHVSNTALIQEYNPNGSLPSWSQNTADGFDSNLSLITPFGFIFYSSSNSVITEIITNLSVFDYVLSGRTIQIEIRNGDTLTSPLLYSNSFLVNNTSQTNYTFNIIGINLIQSNKYTISFLDVTVGGNGYVTLFGINSTSTYVSINTTLYPYLVIKTSGSIGTQDWIQPTNSGIQDTVSVLTEQGFQFSPLNSGVLNSVTFNLTSFESFSPGRSLRVRIKDNYGLTGTIIYDNTFVISNTVATDTALTINNPPELILGNQYTITVTDTTVGGSSTGYIIFYGITPDLTYVSYNINVYPRLYININSIPGQTIVQQGSKLIGTGGILTDRQGYMTSLDDNTTTLAVGGGGFDGAAVGAVWIYTRTNNAWTQQSMLVGTGYVGNSNQGRSVVLSGDGNTVAFGGPGDNGAIGAVWIFTRSGGVWTQQGGKLVGTGYVGTPNQGFDISISRDGNTLVSCGYTDNGNIGATWVFTRTAGVWSQQGGKLVGTGYVGTPNQGFSSSISSDGDNIVVGGNNDNSGNGAVWVFTRTAGVWTQQGGKLVGTGNTGAASQGTSVSISGDSNTLCIGGYTDNGNIGATWVFTKTAGVWTQQGGKLVGTGNTGTSFQGAEAAVELDYYGNTLVVGGSGDNSSMGALWIFTRSGGIWTQQGGKITGTGSSSGSTFGRGIDLNYNASHISSGGIGDGSNKGAAWVFTGFVDAYTQTTNLNNIGGVSVISEQGYQFTSQLGVLTNVVLNLSAFETVDPYRTLRLRIRSGSGLAGAILFSNTYNILNISTRTDYDFNIQTTLTAGTYTLTLQDLTAGGSSTGEIYLYGILPTLTFVSYNSTQTYPRFISYVSLPQPNFSQNTNNSIYFNVDTILENGFKFVPTFGGFLTRITFSYDSFDALADRTITVRIRDGLGVSGTILYQINITLSNTVYRTDYQLDIPTNLAAILVSGSNYTVTFIDITGTGPSTGGVNIYGINSGGNYISYNTGIYPKISLFIPSFIITLSTPQDYAGFIGDGTDTIEFNTQAYDNASTMFTGGLQKTLSLYYQIGLKYIVIPNQLLKVAFGGYLDTYPYIYVHLYNEGNNGVLKTMNSNNPNSIQAIFKIPIDRNLQDIPSSFYTLKPKMKEQIILFRPDQDLRFRVTLPDGTILMSNINDNSSPLFPNQFLQVNALFTLLPVEK